MRQQELVDFVVRLNAAFNKNDLDAVMAFYAEKAVYDELNGRRSIGKPSIRAALAAQFNGAKSLKLKFDNEDVFADGDAGKAVIRWRCTFQNGAQTNVVRGLDIVQVDSDKITYQLSYAKAEKLLVEPLSNPKT